MRKLLILLPLLLFNSCKYTESPAMALSKEMCSCIFVGEQSVDFCKEVTKESRIMAKFKINWEDKTVEARGLGTKAMGALNENPRFGCQIYNVKKGDYKFEKDYY